MHWLTREPGSRARSSACALLAAALVGSDPVASAPTDPVRPVEEPAAEHVAMVRGPAVSRASSASAGAASASGALLHGGGGQIDERASTLSGPAAPLLVASDDRSGRRAGFRILNARTRLVDGVHFLDADIDFAFSNTALEAMQNGVPITVVVEMEVRRKRRFLDKRIASVSARYRIENHPLSNRYIVRNVNSGEAAAYASLEEVTDSIGRISDFPMLDAHLLESGYAHTVRIRALLDVEALPSPLRPLAYLSPTWRLTSDWFEWPIAP